MSVKINKRGKKLFVNFEYNPVVVGICRKVAGRFYNRETKEWMLPADSMEFLVDEFEKIDVDFEVLEDKITAKITKSGSNYHVKFNAFVDGFDTKSLEGAKYSSIDKTYIVPEDQKSKLVRMLNDLNIEFEIPSDKPSKFKKTAKNGDE